VFSGPDDAGLPCCWGACIARGSTMCPTGAVGCILESGRKIETEFLAKKPPVRLYPRTAAWRMIAEEDDNGCHAGLPAGSRVSLLRFP